MTTEQMLEVLERKRADSERRLLLLLKIEEMLGETRSRRGGEIWREHREWLQRQIELAVEEVRVRAQSLGGER